MDADRKLHRQDILCLYGLLYHCRYAQVYVCVAALRAYLAPRGLPSAHLFVCVLCFFLPLPIFFVLIR